jgi:hypothetical protein
MTCRYITFYGNYKVSKFPNILLRSHEANVNSFHRFQTSGCGTTGSQYIIFRRNTVELLEVQGGPKVLEQHQC